MQPTLNIALRAARIAGEQIARAVERLDIIKSEEKSLSEFLAETAAGAERTVAYNLHKANPQHKVTGRHSGEQQGQEGESQTEWRVNPIEGLTNVAHGLPNFALTLACKEKGRIEHVVVLNPITGEEFTASRGRGAQLNGKRIRVSQAKSLEGTLIAGGYGGRGDAPHLDAYLEMCRALYRQGGTLQDAGCTALSLAYLAAGRYDGALLMDRDSWELEAGLLLIQEAGGLMGDLTGNSKILDNGQLVAGNPKLFKLLLQSIHPALPAELRR